MREQDRRRDGWNDYHDTRSRGERWSVPSGTRKAVLGWKGRAEDEDVVDTLRCSVGCLTGGPVRVLIRPRLDSEDMELVIDLMSGQASSVEFAAKDVQVEVFSLQNDVFPTVAVAGGPPAIGWIRFDDRCVPPVVVETTRPGTYSGAEDVLTPPPFTVQIEPWWNEGDAAPVFRYYAQSGALIAVKTATMGQGMPINRSGAVTIQGTAGAHYMLHYRVYG